MFSPSDDTGGNATTKLEVARSEELIARTGLLSIVKQPTQGINRLDRIYVSDVCYDSIKFITSAVKSDHRAMIAHAEGHKPSLRKEKKRRMFCKWTPNQRAMLLRHFITLLNNI